MDLLAAETYWMNTLTFSFTKGGLAPFVGDTLGSKAISPLTFIYCNEIIDQALRLLFPDLRPLRTVLRSA